MLFAGKDGELRLFASPSGTTWYFEVLFCEMDFTGPVSRPRTGETLIMDRGNFDSNAHYIESNDEPRYAMLPMSFSCRLADTVNTRQLHDWLEGQSYVTTRAGTTSIAITTTSGVSAIDGNTTLNLPVKDSGTTPIWDFEMLWDGTSDYGLKYNSVYFPAGEQTITESADGLTLSVNAQIMGDVTRITSFSASTYAFH